MVECDTVVEDRRIVFEGIFSLPDIYKIVDDFFANHGYDKYELKNYEVVKPDGKMVEIQLEPKKTVTDYAKYIVNIRITGTNLQEVEVTKDGRTSKMSQGKVMLIFNAFLYTDTEGQWENKPIYYMLRGVYNKFFYHPVTSSLKTEIKGHVGEVVNQLKAFLNLAKFR